MPAPAANSSAFDVINRVLNVIGKLAPRYRPALIAAVLEVVLIIVLVNIVPATATEAIVGILGLASVPILLATAQKVAPKVIPLVLIFCYLLIGRIYPQPRTGIVTVRPHDDSAEPTVPKRPVAASVLGGKVLKSADSVRIVGNVRYADTNVAVEGAFVDVEGYSSRYDTTDAKGAFEIMVPRWITEMGKNRVLLAIQTTRIDTTSRSLDQLPFRIALARGPDRVAAAPDFASHARMAVRSVPPAPTPTTAPADQEMVLTRIILDSLVTVHDGSMGITHWRFDIFVNAANAMTIPWTSYSNRQGRNKVRLGGETTVSLAPRHHASIRIQGLRDAWIGVTQALGAESVAIDSIPAGEPLHRSMRVHVASDRDAGEFVFYYTLMRRGTPNIRVTPPVQMSPQGKLLERFLPGES